MSLSSVEKALKDSEAIKYYDSTKEEKSALEDEVISLKNQMSDKTSKYEGTIQKLEGRVAELEGLRIRFNENHYTLESFEKLVSTTVEKAYHAKIKSGVEDRWAAEAPSRVKEALKRDLSGFPWNCSPEARTAIESAGKTQAESILSNKFLWPPWFKGQVDEEVRRLVGAGLDEEFNRRVNDQASKEIARRVNYEWPKFLSEKVTPKFQGTLTDQLKMLNQTIRIYCDRCGSGYDVDVGPELMAFLIKEPSYNFRCTNASCRDWIFPHNFPLTLGYVIYYITCLSSQRG